MTLLDRILRSIQLLAIAGAIVALSVVATAAAGVIAGSESPTIPAPFVGLFCLLCAALGGVATRLLTRCHEAAREE